MSNISKFLIGIFIILTILITITGNEFLIVLWLIVFFVGMFSIDASEKSRFNNPERSLYEDDEYDKIDNAKTDDSHKTKPADAINTKSDKVNRDIIGEKVFHKIFNYGIIKSKREQNGKIYITVEFKEKISDFVFPDAFKGQFLVACSTNLINIVNQSPTIPKKNDFPQKHRLIYDKCYGTNSRNIYLSCCGLFGWEKSKANNFGKQGTLLYAKSATPEGFSPWFLFHHNIGKTTSKKWRNTIEGDFIYEEWNKTGKEIFDDTTARVVFVKLEGYYRFYGIYRVENIELKTNKKYIKTYRRISKEYSN